MKQGKANPNPTTMPKDLKLLPFTNNQSSLYSTKQTKSKKIKDCGRESDIPYELC